MKKLKLLSSLSALVLVLSLGACNNNSGDDVTSDDTDSSETTPTVEDITLSFSFVDATGAASTIPEYATAYVIGSWDSWSEFIPLTEKDGAYSTTFNELTIGSFTYKVVEWYTGESVSWSDCVEITTTDQTLTVSEEDANSTISVTHTLSAVLDKLGVLEGEEAEEIILSLLLAIDPEVVGWIDETWESAHITELWEGDIDEIYMAYNRYGYLEGTWKTIDEDGDSSLEYIVGGAVYDVVDGEFEFSYIYDDDLSSLLEDYGWIVLEATDNIVYGEDDTEYENPLLEFEEGVEVTLERGVKTYTLTITEDDEVDTIVTDWSFEIISVGSVSYDEDEVSESYLAEKVTQAEVEAQIADFKSTIDYIVDDVVENCNYFMDVTYSEEQSLSYTADELFDENGNIDSSKAVPYYGQYFDSEYYFTDDALLIYYYYYYFNSYWDYGWALWDAELYVNNYELGMTEVYYLYDFYEVDEETGEYATDEDGDYIYVGTYFSLAGYLETLYQDTFYTLMDLDGISSDISLVGSAKSSYLWYTYYYELYTTSSYTIANVLFNMATLGNSIAEYYGYDYYIDAYDIDYIQYEHSTGTLMFGFNNYGYWFYYYDYETDEEDNYVKDDDGNYIIKETYYFWDNMYIDVQITNVGSTSLPSSMNQFIPEVED